MHLTTSLYCLWCNLDGRGDALVAARHLVVHDTLHAMLGFCRSMALVWLNHARPCTVVKWMQHFGYSPSILYPKRNKKPLFQVRQ